MLMLPFLSLSQMDSTDNVRWRLSQKLAEQAAKTVRGQVEELEIVKDQHLTQERYFRAIRGKTGGFFSLPIEGAALIAGLDERDAAALGVCFMELGTLFQLQDDVLDLYGEKGRKQRGADIYEGKPSILVYHHLKLHPEDKEYVWNILSKSRMDTSQKEVFELIQTFRDSGALDDTLQDIKNQRQALLEYPVLHSYPEMKRLLLSMIELVLKPISELLCP